MLVTSKPDIMATAQAGAGMGGKPRAGSGTAVPLSPSRSNFPRLLWVGERAAHQSQIFPF